MRDETLIAMLSADEAETRIDALGRLLHACVHDGASVGFVLPFGEADSRAFWRGKIVAAIRAGGTALLVAERRGIVGCVVLDHDTPPNQRHRAEIRKLLVHPALHRQGIARALMTDVEHLARRLGRTLLTLDTRTGDAAEPLYTSLGYTTAGVIPGYCRDPIEDRLDSTTIMYKAL